ncbi:MAG: class I SAM-dependent methyltransferase, partial [Clostridiales bacterium]
PVYLVINGICPQVIATDLARDPYENACQLVDLLSLSRQIQVRLGDGLAPLEPGEVDTITIAGMGGFLISDILSKSPLVLMQTKRLVLQPQKNAATLRRWLMENGWLIVTERLALDHGFYYEIIAAEHGAMQLTAEELEFGPRLLGDPHPLLLKYLLLKKGDWQALAEQMSGLTGQRAQKRLVQLTEAIASIEKIINRLI